MRRKFSLLASCLLLITYCGTAQLVGTAGFAGGGGTAGAALDAGVESSSDRCDTVLPRFINASVNDSSMKMAAKIAVVRVSRLAVPRPDMNEPMPWEVPMPNPPPSLRWIRTTPISARVTNRWTISNTVLKKGSPKGG